MILASPYQMIVGHFDVAALAVQAAFEFGVKGMTCLAFRAFDALEHWMDHIPSADFEPFLRSSVVPKLEPFLSCFNASPKLTDTDAVATKSKHKNSANIPIRVYIDHAKLVKEAGLDSGDASETSRLSRRVITFLGKVGTNVTSELSQVKTEQVMAWDMVKHIKFEIPFPDLRFSIELDSLLPRVCHLAETSSDQQIKTSACEFLHSVVILAVGRRC
jgi:DNA-dependent protein kinase catalytic subunit